MSFIIAEESTLLKSVALLVNSLLLVIPLCNLSLIPFIIILFEKLINGYLIVPCQPQCFTTFLYV